MWVLLLALYAQPQYLEAELARYQFVRCECACVEGRALTLCDSLDQAQENPHQCANSLQCPSFEASQPDSLRLLLDPPQDGAVNCRQVQVWDTLAESYRVKRICDVLSS